MALRPSLAAQGGCSPRTPQPRAGARSRMALRPSLAARGGCKLRAPQPRAVARSRMALRHPWRSRAAVGCVYTAAPRGGALQDGAAAAPGGLGRL